MENDPLTIAVNTLAQRISLLGGSQIMRYAGTRSHIALGQMQLHFSQPYDNPTEFLVKLRENRASLLNALRESLTAIQQSPAEALEGLSEFDTPGRYQGQPARPGDAGASREEQLDRLLFK